MKLSRKIILASHSPRRSQILSEAGISFEQRVMPVEETYSKDMDPLEVPVYLSGKKAAQFTGLVGEEIVICADTLVVVGQEILEKPASRDEGLRMLRRLSGRTHLVVTAVSMLDRGQITSVSDVAEVTFRPLEDEEIIYYLDRFQPYDKAGGYGIQEWIGMIGIERIRGSYYTIMGMPIHKLYTMLRPYIVFT